jgi:hypothetical protein
MQFFCVSPSFYMIHPLSFSKAHAINTVYCIFVAVSENHNKRGTPPTDGQLSPFSLHHHQPGKCGDDVD